MASWPRDRAQPRVAEQVARAEAGAVEDQPLGQASDLGGRGEIADLDPSAGDFDVADHLPQIAPGLDVERVEAGHVRDRERMLGGAEQAVVGREGRQELPLQRRRSSRSRSAASVSRNRRRP